MKTFLVIILLAGARWWVMSTPDHFIPWLPSSFFLNDNFSLTRQIANTSTSLLFLVLIPLMTIRSSEFSKKSLFAVGFPQLTYLQYRALLILVMCSVVLGVVATSFMPSLRASYPVFRGASKGFWFLLLSESLTVAMILVTELFYRGVALSLLYQRLGSSALYLLALVYGLDHIGAPTSELAGSFLVALLLGRLALATKSIWPGFMVHVSCAVAVDITSVFYSCRV